MSNVSFSNLPWRYALDTLDPEEPDHCVLDCEGNVVAMPPTEAEARAIVALPGLYGAVSEMFNPVGGAGTLAGTDKWYRLKDAVMAAGFAFTGEATQ